MASEAISRPGQSDAATEAAAVARVTARGRPAERVRPGQMCRWPGTPVVAPSIEPGRDDPRLPDVRPLSLEAFVLASGPFHDLLRGAAGPERGGHDPHRPVHVAEERLVARAQVVQACLAVGRGGEPVL